MENVLFECLFHFSAHVHTSHKTKNSSKTHSYVSYLIRHTFYNTKIKTIPETTKQRCGSVLAHVFMEPGLKVYFNYYCLMSDKTKETSKTHFYFSCLIRHTFYNTNIKISIDFYDISWTIPETTSSVVSLF